MKLDHPLFETVIPTASIDLNKLPYVVDALYRYTDTCGVHIITPEPKDVPDLSWPGVFVHADSDVLDFDRTRFKHRPNWVFQQFLKLFQNVTLTDWYLVIDADLIFARSVKLFEEMRPVFLLGNDQYHEPYFCFNQKMLGIGKTYEFSFLSECTLYKKQLVDRMLEHGRYTSPQHFMECAAEVIDGGCYPAESELYGSYIHYAFPGLYTFRRLHAALGGKYGGKPYTNQEIEDRIKEVTQWGDVDILTVHSWEGG